MSERPVLPSLNELARDLLLVSAWPRTASLVLPFVLATLFFVFGARGWWLPALACPVLLSFFTYGSISHDLVHRTLGLPSWLNEALLFATELITFRSGHTYRVTHLHVLHLSPAVAGLLLFIVGIICAFPRNASLPNPGSSSTAREVQVETIAGS